MTLSTVGEQNASGKRPDCYALKVDPGTSWVYLWDGHRQLFSFDSWITFCSPEIVTDWPTVGYTTDMGPWRKGEYTTVNGWQLFLADPYTGPCVALNPFSAHRQA